MLIRWKSKDKNSNSSSSSKKKRKGREGGNFIFLSFISLQFSLAQERQPKRYSIPEMDSIWQQRRVCCVVFCFGSSHIDMESLNEWQTNIYLLFILMSTGAVHANIYSQLAQTRFGSCDGIECRLNSWPHENGICSELCAWQPQAKRTISDWKTFLRRAYLLNTQWMNSARRKLHCWLSPQCAVTSIFISFRNANEVKLRHSVCVQTIRAIDRGRLEFFTSFTTVIISFVCVCECV